MEKTTRQDDEIKALKRELVGARTRRPQDVDDIVAALARRGVKVDGRPEGVQTRGRGKSAEEKAAEKAAKDAAKQAAADAKAAEAQAKAEAEAAEKAAAAAAAAAGK